MKKLFLLFALVISMSSVSTVAQASYSSQASHGEWTTISDTVLGITYQCAQIHDHNWLYLREWKCILNGVEYWATCYEEEYDAGDGGTSTRTQCDVSGMWNATPAIGLAAANQGAHTLRTSLIGGGYAHLPGWSRAGAVFVSESNQDHPNDHC